MPTTTMRPQPDQGPASSRLMWISPDRVFYAGLLGTPSVRTMGTYMVYVATVGQVHVRLPYGGWDSGQMAVVPPYMPHQVHCDERAIYVVKVEAETVDRSSLISPLTMSGVIHAPEFVEHVRRSARNLCQRSPEFDLGEPGFDRLFFGGNLPRPRIDRRIQTVIDRIKADPGGAATAQECAEAVQLSIPRFLHLFKQEVEMPFRKFRMWKRARSILYYVDRDSNLTHVALDAGYPDSTHFSHSIRSIYGLKPKDIFAGSRRLVVLGDRNIPGAGATNVLSSSQCFQ